MTRVLPLLKLLVTAVATVLATGEEPIPGTAGYCQELTNDVHLELHLFPACRSSKHSVNTVFDVVERFAGSSRIAITLAPITCGFGKDCQLVREDSECGIVTRYIDQHAECVVLHDGKRFRKDGGESSSKGWGDAALCLQAAQLSASSPDKVRLLRCLATNATTADRLKTCGVTYGSWEKELSTNTNLHNCIQSHRGAVSRAWGRAELSGVVTDPTLLINGHLYCGSYSFKDLTAAICAASTIFPTAAFAPSSQSCNLWWNMTDARLDESNSGSCSVKQIRSTGRLMEALAIICFVMVSSTFLFMVLSRRRLDAMLSQQRRREASGRRLHELLSVLAAANRGTQPLRPSGEVDEAIRALVVKRYAAKPSVNGEGANAASESGGSDSTCTICLEPMAEGEEFYDLEGCDHVYHTECLKVWLQKKNECPICRRSILNLPEPSSTNESGIELRTVSRNNRPGVERVINFTTANGANVTISLSTNSQVALSMT